MSLKYSSAPARATATITGPNFAHNVRVHVDTIDGVTIQARSGGGPTSGLFLALNNAIRQFYNSNASISAWKIETVPTATAGARFLSTQGSATAGTSASATFSPAGNAIIFNSKDSANFNSKFVLLDTSVWSGAKLSPGYGVPYSTLYTALSAAGILSFNGNPITTPLSITQPINRRLRRHYKQA